VKEEYLHERSLRSSKVMITSMISGMVKESTKKMEYAVSLYQMMMVKKLVSLHMKFTADNVGTQPHSVRKAIATAAAGVVANAPSTSVQAAIQLFLLQKEGWYQCYARILYVWNAAVDAHNAVVKSATSARNEVSMCAKGHVAPNVENGDSITAMMDLSSCAKPVVSDVQNAVGLCAMVVVAMCVDSIFVIMVVGCFVKLAVTDATIAVGLSVRDAVAMCVDSIIVTMTEGFFVKGAVLDATNAVGLCVMVAVVMCVDSIFVIMVAGFSAKDAVSDATIVAGLSVRDVVATCRDPIFVIMVAGFSAKDAVSDATNVAGLSVRDVVATCRDPIFVIMVAGFSAVVAVLVARIAMMRNPRNKTLFIFRQRTNTFMPMSIPMRRNQLKNFVMMRMQRCT
jgi:hypothetical protein